MPRDGTETYVLPFPDVVTHTPVESPVYNGFTADIAQDLNTPRPIKFGGTGADSAANALTNIGAEKNNQIVTNYDSHTWVAGSFSAASSATAPPVAAHAFSGIVYLSDSNNIVVEARDATDGKLYIRRKVASVWGAWAGDTAASDAAIATKVAKAGDSMSGSLTIDTAQPTIMFRKTAGNSIGIVGYTGANGRWLLELGNSIAESGSNAGSDFTLSRFNDAGALVGTPFSINRASGAAAFNNNLAIGTSAAAGGTLTFGSSGARTVTHDGTHYAIAGGNWNVLADITSSAAVWSMQTATTGKFQFGSSTTKHLAYDGTNFIFTGGGVTVPSLNSAAAVVAKTLSLSATGGDPVGMTVTNGNYCRVMQTVTGTRTWAHGVDPSGQFLISDESVPATRLAISTGGNWDFLGGFLKAGAYYGRQGISGAYHSVVNNMYYASGPMQLWADATNLGNISVISDYRTKKDVVALPSTWDAVKALRPIKYTQKDFSPPSHKGDDPFIRGDNCERWGFMAHELQETLIMEAATGAKDAPDAIQSPNPMIVIAALTKALQEAMARIEALEAK